MIRRLLMIHDATFIEGWTLGGRQCQPDVSNLFHTVLPFGAFSQDHAPQKSDIVQLGEDPDLNPATLLSRSHAEYDEKTSLREMLEADLVAERIAIESYREMIDFIGPRDPTSRRLLESILAQEEEHAEDLVDLLEDLPKD